MPYDIMSGPLALSQGVRYKPRSSALAGGPAEVASPLFITG